MLLTGDSDRQLYAFVNASSNWRLREGQEPAGTGAAEALFFTEVPIREGIRLPMPDIMSPAERSARMALIRGKDTKPELIVRKLLHGLGYRYQLHRRDLPGKPDLTFPSRQKIIYVHGCFWHQHAGCSVAHIPAARRDFWLEKFRRNTERDAQNLTNVQALGWQALVVWECETRDKAALERTLTSFLGPPGRSKR